MSFDEEHDGTEADAGKHKTFFGLETGDGVVYAVVIILLFARFL